jgi:hypothetical protein
LTPSSATDNTAAMADPESDEPTLRTDSDRHGLDTSLWSRRSTLVGVTLGAALGTGLISGCKPCFPAVAPLPPTTEHPGPRTLTVRATISPGKYRALRRLLDDEEFNPFEVAAEGIHYARLFTTNETSLFFMVIYDDYLQALAFLTANAAGVDGVFAMCEGYPSAGASDPAAIAGFVHDHLVCTELFYRAYDQTQPQIRDALALRKHFLAFLRGIDGVGESTLADRYTTLCDNPHLESAGVTPGELVVPSPEQLALESHQPLELEATAGLVGRVNPFTLLARVRDDQLRKVQRTLRLGTWATIDLGMRPLSNLPTLHFARVSIINGNQMLFASVYDGDFIQYVEDFGTRIAKEIDKVFGACVGYPLAGSRDVSQFKDFLRSHQIQTNAFAGGYLDHSLLEIKASLALSKALHDFSRRVNPKSPRLRSKLDKFLQQNQQLLT